MVSAISGEKESAIRVTMLSCASFFCSPTRRSNADSAGKTTRRPLSNSWARTSSRGGLLQTPGLLESEALQGVALIQVKRPQAEILLDTSLMLRNRMLLQRVVRDP